MNRLVRPLSLRAKVSLLVAGVLAAAMLAFGVVLYVAIERALIETTAMAMRASARGAIDVQINNPRGGRGGRGEGTLPLPATGMGRGGNAPAGPSPTPLDATRSLYDLARFLTTRDTAARTTDTEGQPVGDGPALTGDTSTPAPLLDSVTYWTVAASGRGRHFRLDTDDGPVLVALVPLVRETVSPPQAVGVLQLTTSLRGVDDFLGGLRLLLGVGALLTVALTVALLLPLVARLLRPLRRVAAASHEIAAGDLSRRVPVPHGGDELTDLATAFNEMVGRLETAFATQRRFVADASHELRTPLTALGGGVEMLIMEADRADPAARARLLRLMESEIARMGRLVDDLLTLTRFDANPIGTLRRAPVDVTALAADVADETRLLAPDRRVLLDGPADVAITVSGDADRLRQALLNLLANARAYTPPDGAITVGVRAEGGNAVLSVADTGAGIAPDDLPRVWDRFYRADPSRVRQAGQGGLGLGLAIVQAIARAHGGTIAIASTPGVGTTVTLTLPGATTRTRGVAEPTTPLPTPAPR